MKITAHHTCKKEGSKAEIIANAPFESIHDPENDKYQFLGTGCYLWDYNLNYAKVWGRIRYNNRFYVIECELNLPESLFLDLVGNRKDMAWLLHMPVWLKEEGFYDLEEIWTVGNFIELLKELRKETGENEIFPYKAIRSIDNNAKIDELIGVKFVDNKEGFINLNPRLVVCLTEKNELLLLSKKIIYES